MLNSVCLIGRLTKDIDLRTFEDGGKAAYFSLAVQRNYTNQQGDYEADFFDCCAAGGTADILSKYFKKGDFCPVNGELKTRKWLTEDGQIRTVTFVNVKNVTFVSSKRESAPVLQNDNQGYFPDPVSMGGTLDIPMPENDDDLPF